MFQVVTPPSGDPDLWPHLRDGVPNFVSTVERVRASLTQTPFPEEWTWLALLDDDTTLAEIDGVGWGLQVEATGLLLRVTTMGLVNAKRPAECFVWGIPVSYTPMFRRRRYLTPEGVNYGALTIVGAAPQPGHASPAGYLFIGGYGHYTYSSDFNAY